MGRLIDAEPLIKFFEQKRIEWFDLDIGTSTAYDIARQAVEEAPTVEAIPIEWLEKFGVTRYQKNLISNIIGTWREGQSNETD